MEETETPDLSDAEVFIEADPHPVAGGRWFAWPGTDRVIYQRPNGDFVHKSMVAAHTLRSSPTWRRVDPEPAATD